MSSIDSRIVTMKFDNTAFQKGISTTMSTLDKFKSMLTSLPGASKGLSALQSVGSRFNLSGIGGAIDGIDKKFIAMSTIAITALTRITNAAFDAGIKLTKSLTLDPILAGYQEYATNLNSIQTILANTQASGATLDDVNAALAQLNKYSDKTIYNFSEMAKNIGTFTAAGVDLDTSVASIKGIANLAALSGSNSQQASTAMYQLSQAISAGKVGLQDWNSVVNAGMGGATFQRALAETAVAMGKIDDSSLKLSGSMKNVTIDGSSFRNSIMAAPGKESWLTSDVLTNTLKQFTGDMSKAELKAQGFNDAQIKSIQAMAKTAEEAATKVKTVTQLIDVAKETAGSGWAKTWQLVFGDFQQSRRAMTNASNTINGFINQMSNARNRVLKDWQELGGRAQLIRAIQLVWRDLLLVIKPIKNAFRDVFPATTGKTLFNMTVALKEFLKGLKMGGKTADGFKRTLRGFFAAFDIGRQILGGVIRYFTSLFGLVSHGSGGVLSLTGSIGDLLFNLDQWLKKGDKIGSFFDAIIEGRAKALGPLIEFLGRILTALGGLVSLGGKALGSGLFSGFQGLAPILESITTSIGAFFDSLNNGLSNIDFSGLGAIGDVLNNAFSGVGGGGAGGGLGSLFDITDQTDAAAAGIDNVKGHLAPLASAGEQVKSAWDHVVDAFKAVGEFLAPVWPFIKSIFGGIKDKLLAFVDGMGIQDGLAIVNTGFFIAFYLMLRNFLKSMTGITDGLGKMFDSVGGTFDQLTSNLKTMQNDVRANMILKIAIAVAVLTASLYVLSKLDTKNLALSLGAIGIMMTLLVKSMSALTGGVNPRTVKDTAIFSAKMAALSLGLVAFSTAVLIMSAAIAVLGNLKVSTITKGLVAMAVIIGGLVATVKALNESGGSVQMIAAAAGLAILAVALLEMAAAVKLYASIDTETIISGVLKIAGLIVGIGLAMKVMPPNMLASAAALLIVAGALVAMSVAMKVFASMSPGEMTKSLLMLAASLLIIGIAMAGMAGGLAGAAAMFIFAAALAVMVPPLMLLGKMSLKEIGIALLALVGVFVVLGLASLILAPIVPIMFALAAAIALLGVGVLAVGAGMLFFSMALATLAVSGAAGAAVLVAAIITIVEIFPLIMQQIGLGIVAMADVIANAGPQLVNAMQTLVMSAAQAVINSAPKIGKAFGVILATGLKVVEGFIPKMYATGLKIIIGILNAIADNIGGVIKAGVSIIVNFLKGLGDELPKIADAAAKAVIKFIHGIADAIDNNATDLRNAGLDLGMAIINGMTGGLLGEGLQMVKDAAMQLADALPGWMRKVLGINSPSKVTHEIGAFTAQGLAKGIDDNGVLVRKSAEGVGRTAMDTLKASMSGASSLVAADISMNPVISPILDLTNLQRDATKIGGMIGSGTVKADLSLSRASSISADQRAATEAAAIASEQNNTPREVKFEQNNYSPKALSPIEIYRNTQSQLSLAKEALNVP